MCKSDQTVFHDKSGTSLAECTVLAALIVIAIVALMGDVLDGKFEEFKDCIASNGDC